MKNKSVKKSLKKSKKVLKEKRKNGHAKNLHKKEHHISNNCNELRSRALKHKYVGVLISSLNFWINLISIVVFCQVFSNVSYVFMIQKMRDIEQ